jgi:hypothetical protein
MEFHNGYEWGKLFSSPWEEIVRGMNSRASEMSLTQVVRGRDIFWLSGTDAKAKFCFVPDPSDIETIRRIFNDEEDASLPLCSIVVTQPDPSDARGDVIFDIFRMSPESYLWHFNRVFTLPVRGD